MRQLLDNFWTMRNTNSGEPSFLLLEEVRSETFQYCRMGHSPLCAHATRRSQLETQTLKVVPGFRPVFERGGSDTQSRIEIGVLRVRRVGSAPFCNTETFHFVPLLKVGKIALQN